MAHCGMAENPLKLTPEDIEDGIQKLG